MVASDEAAFRILEISAILFPLLFIVIQLFSRQFLADRETPLVELGKYARYVIYASLLLLVAVAMASSELLNNGLSLRITVGITALYVVFIFLGYTAAISGAAVSKAVDEQSEQLDLTRLTEEVEAAETEEARES